MPLRFLLDTNICIYIAKNRPEGVLTRFLSLEPGDVAMSAITYGELKYGAFKSRHQIETHKILNELTSMIQVLAIDEKAGDRYGEIRLQLEKSGCVIGNNDLWIAAHALALGVPLVTNNEKEFRRVPGLTLQNWIRESDRSQVQEKAAKYCRSSKKNR
jgi:tRNA(fMet)-specific endonuclease VapC